MSDTANEKIMGFIPKGKYVYMAYMMMFVSCLGSTIFTVMETVGMSTTTLAPGIMLVGILGLVMALMGRFVYKAKFSAHDQTHFGYASIIYALFFFASMLSGGAYLVSPVLSLVLIVAVSLGSSALMYTGYSAWQEGRVVTMSNYRDEMKIALKKR